MKRVLAIVIIALSFLLISDTSANAAPPTGPIVNTVPPAGGNQGAKAICNRSTRFQLGVIHSASGPHAFGNYDERLPVIDQVHQAAYCTTIYGWPHAIGFYMPAGYRGDIYDHTQLNFLASINGSGFKFFNNPNETYWIDTCQYVSSGQCIQ
jgi:hypothetical protein